MRGGRQERDARPGRRNTRPPTSTGPARARMRVGVPLRRVHKRRRARPRVSSGRRGVPDLRGSGEPFPRAAAWPGPSHAPSTTMAGAPGARARRVVAGPLHGAVGPAESQIPSHGVCVPSSARKAWRFGELSSSIRGAGVGPRFPAWRLNAPHRVAAVGGGRASIARLVADASASTVTRLRSTDPAGPSFAPVTAFEPRLRARVCRACIVPPAGPRAPVAGCFAPASACCASKEASHSTLGYPISFSAEGF